VQAADGELNGEAVRFVAVVPDANNHFPRAAKGEVGLLEGWTLAKVVSETVAADADKAVKRPIVAVIDVPARPMAAAKRRLVFTRRWPVRQRLCQCAPGRSSGDWAYRRQSDVRRVSGARLPG
jgi:hypothetical protein